MSRVRLETDALGVAGMEGAVRPALGPVSVVGLGKLGACTAACFAYRGIRTLGLDVNADSVAAVNAGKAPVYEPRLDELLAAAGPHLSATQDYDRLIEETDATFLIVPTPSREDGQFSDAHLRDALVPLARALGTSRKSYHLFVITSTVSPGTTTGRLIPLIEVESGRRLNDGFGVCYNPEFIALGSVITDFLNPDLVLIGESDSRAGDLVEDLQRAVCENDPRVARMSLVSAEITKLSLNAFVTMKISFANTLAQLCEAIPDADIDAITAALGADRRIAPYALRGGVAYGGPCFPRDNLAFRAFAGECGVDARLAQATHDVNLDQGNRLVDLVLRLLETTPGSVAVLGLAYKPNTPVIDESAAVMLVEALVRHEVLVNVYDPLALGSLRARLGDRVRYASSVREAVRGASLVVLASPEFSEVSGDDLGPAPVTVVDCWRAADPRRYPKSVRWIQLGRFHERFD